MAIIDKKFNHVQEGQVWLRKNPRNATSPHILVLAVVTRHGIATPCVKARTYDGEKNLVGSTTVYPYLENLESGYEYLGVLKPEPEVGAILKRYDGKGYLRVQHVTDMSCKVADWDRKNRMFLSESRTLKLDATFWDYVGVFWPKKSKVT